MRIGFDIDGVLANFPPAYEKLFVRATGVNNFPPPHPKGPLSWNWPTDHHGYTAANTKVVWNLIKSDPTFWQNLPDYDFVTARFVAWYNTNEGHELYFVTDRSGINVKAQTEKWFDRKGIQPTVLISGQKGMICAALNLDMYVDDKGENIEDVRQKSPRTEAYLIDRNYNQHISVPNRIEYLNDFLKAIDAKAGR